MTEVGEVQTFSGPVRAADLGATLRQIGAALGEVGDYAAGYGVEVRLEVHGPVTSLLPHVARILRHADHANVVACWNSNATDVEDGSVARSYAQVAGRVGLVHLHDLTDASYPWRELFRLLRRDGYQGFTLAEIAESSDPMRVLDYFRALWQELQ